jgi:hypothetical protein
MRTLDKWRRLSRSRLRTLPGALAVVLFVRLCLRLLPVRAWGRATARHRRVRRPAMRDTQTAAQDVVWAVRSVSRVVPGATCLTQALAAQVLLSRRGCMSRVRIGVARGPAGGLLAHAWLESDGVVVLGGPHVESYTPLNLAVVDAEHFNLQWEGR